MFLFSLRLFSLLGASTFLPQVNARRCFYVSQQFWIIPTIVA
jgi:hypothetical protein